MASYPQCLAEPECGQHRQLLRDPAYGFLRNLSTAPDVAAVSVLWPVFRTPLTMGVGIRWPVRAAETRRSMASMVASISADRPHLPVSVQFGKPALPTGSLRNWICSSGNYAIAPPNFGSQAVQPRHARTPAAIPVSIQRLTAMVSSNFAWSRLIPMYWRPGPVHVNALGCVPRHPNRWSVSRPVSLFAGALPP